MPPARGFFASSRLREQAPARSLPQCGACGMFKRCASPRMPVTGAGGRSVLVVGEAPGATEDTEGLPFVGKAGQVLRRTLRGLGFALDTDAWSTDAIICHPAKNRKPTSAEIRCCRPNLERTIRELQPTVIVPLGSAAVNAVIGPVWREDTGQINRWAGWCIPSQDLNAWVCPTWHPSFVLREDDSVIDKQFRRHLEAAFAQEGHPWSSGVPDWGGQVECCTDITRAARWLRRCAAQHNGAIAWDYETNMLKPDGPDARIVSCAVAWGRRKPERCIAFPWHGEAIEAMGELLRSPIPKIASNLKFEDRWTRKAFGSRVRAWAWDTMLAAHVLDNRPNITSVKFQAFVRCGAPVWNDKVEPYLKSGPNETINRIFEEIAIEDLLLYNGLDALFEFQVAADQINEMGCPIPWST